MGLLQVDNHFLFEGRSRLYMASDGPGLDFRNIQYCGHVTLFPLGEGKANTLLLFTVLYGCQGKQEDKEAGAEQPSEFEIILLFN